MLMDAKNCNDTIFKGIISVIEMQNLLFDFTN